MGQETRPTLVKSGGGPTRCPTCQEEVRREDPTWIACEACLVRHHAACWRDACTSCGEKSGLRPAPTSPISGASGATAGPDSATAAVPRTAGRAPAVRALLPALELSVGDGATSPAEVSLRIATGRDRPEPFLVAVRNASAEPQRVELRKLPPWLRVDGAAEREIAPGATERFRVLLDPGAAAFSTRSLGDGSDDAPEGSPPVPRGPFGTRLKTSRSPDLSLDSAFDGTVRGRFVVSAPDRAWTVALKAYRDPSARALLGNACLLVMIPPLGLVLTLAMLYLGLPPWRRAGESDASICYRRRAARSCRLQSLALAFVAASIVGLIVLAQNLSG